VSHVSLPDVDVLLAVAWPNHQFHDSARSWLREVGPRGWSTCSITRIGFIRLSSNPGFTPHARTPLEATLLLGRLIEIEGHQYVEGPGPGVCPEFAAVAKNLQGHRQTTDAYLLALARVRGLRLVTFDRRIERFSPFADTVQVLAA